MVDTEQEKIIDLTEAAATAIKQSLSANGISTFQLRIGVQGGGCSGMQYFMAPEENIQDTDLVIEFGDVKIVVDQASSSYLKGTTIDYETTLQQSGFKFNNPNAKRCCGCKNSFSCS